MTDDDILWELYIETCSDDHETEILDGDSHITKTSSHKHCNLAP
jgi:hypothetical protein